MPTADIPSDGDPFHPHAPGDGFQPPRSIPDDGSPARRGHGDSGVPDPHLHLASLPAHRSARRQELTREATHDAFDEGDGPAPSPAVPPNVLLAVNT
ncbi:MAG: hypothetical protein EA398_09500 [Deltaproteobacteria bacterium]|nr:MAG: hypothetical protein EA398_09500 [Deltaproteobacteria bacterium]